MAGRKLDRFTMIAEEEIPNAIEKIGEDAKIQYVGKAVCYGTVENGTNPLMKLAQPDNLNKFAGVLEIASANSYVHRDDLGDSLNTDIPEGKGGTVERNRSVLIKVSDAAKIAAYDWITLDADGEFKTTTDKDKAVGRALDDGEPGSVIRAFVVAM